MRLVTFSQRGAVRVGALVSQSGQDYVLDFSQALPAAPTDMVGFLSTGDTGMAAAKQAVASSKAKDLLPFSEVTLQAPILNPEKIVCLGYNYYAHTGKGNDEIPEFPTFFTKTNNTIIGPDQPIIIPRVTNQVDYEAEFAVVIGKKAHHVKREQAFDYIAGYTIFNDVSARDYQRRSTQWLLGKSFDTFGPMGPAIVTKDEVPDPQNLVLTLSRNGIETQHINTNQMIFQIPFLMEYLTDVMTLVPGDLISTGTPARMSVAQTLPPFLLPGDVLRIEIEHLGSLTNTLAAEEA